MILQSSTIIEAKPEHIWPSFFQAKMDDRHPVGFRFGLPKPIECMVIDGDGSPGSVRRCVTTRGNMDQRILVSKPYEHFSYQLLSSTYWGQPFISKVQDDLTLHLKPDGKTEVVRVTTFNGRWWTFGLSTLLMRLGFLQAHRYAYENWRRLATERKIASA